MTWCTDAYIRQLVPELQYRAHETELIKYKDAILPV